MCNNLHSWVVYPKRVTLGHSCRSLVTWDWASRLAFIVLLTV